MNQRDRDIQQGKDTTQQPAQTATTPPSVRDQTAATDSSTDRETSDMRDTSDRRDTATARDPMYDRDTSDRDTTEDSDQGFLPPDRMNNLRERWNDVQAGFVDDPRSAVQKAQQLVGELVNELTETFSRERGTLEGQWSQGGEADTEAQRVALQRYRSFFNRLLNT